MPLDPDISRKISAVIFSERRAEEMLPPRTVENVCVFAGIEIEDNMCRTFDLRHAMQKWMQLQRGDARRPDQRAAGR